MIGLDTNVLLRAILEDDPDQSFAAQRFLGRCSEERPGWVSVIVLCECVWVLRRRGYNRYAVATTLSGLLDSAELLFEDVELVQDAVVEYARSSADFADCLIGLRNQTKGTTHTVTFDRAAAKLPGFELLATDA